MTYKERYKALSPVKRAMFRQFMADASINQYTWRKWFQRNRVPDKMRERQIRIMLRKLNNL
jgi:hypothetical protein